MTETTQIVICGTRTKHPRAQHEVGKILDLYRPENHVVIIHGAAPGVDTIVDQEANKRGFMVLPKHANWNRYGAAAGPRRNAEMIACRPAHVYCLPFPSLKESKGTYDTYCRAKAAGIPVTVVELPSFVVPPPPTQNAGQN